MSRDLTRECPPATQQPADGPAFPVPPGSQNEGITIRDWLAALAMQGLLSKGLEVQADRALSQEDKDNLLADHAYRLADALIRRRAKRAGK